MLQPTGQISCTCLNSASVKFAMHEASSQQFYQLFGEKPPSFDKFSLCKNWACTVNGNSVKVNACIVINVHINKSKSILKMCSLNECFSEFLPQP